MTPLLRLVAIFQLLVLPTRADFYIYNTFLEGDKTIQKFTFIPNNTAALPTCDGLVNPKDAYEVVSSLDKLDTQDGTYCEGKGCAWDTREPSSIDILEFRKNDQRLAVNKTAGWVLMDLDWPMSAIIDTGPQFAPVAYCDMRSKVDPELICSSPGDPGLIIQGAMVLYCEESEFSGVR
ncbi:hypothetical protein QBC34DRAFT_493805 [Podospora aff. communis PSN243]|uniref:Peptidase A1 domain-containing protein n=1 Tax=Podospora aff. communis PSN243 TaxID=3040156 RepID=A0AAV9GNZ4_9PEZI|nr:hypothetical protein QBC34DRAFT_493805 [Podospora aff. communis PSN243]